MHFTIFHENCLKLRLSPLFQSSGIWDEIRIDSVTSPSTTQVLTISAAPLTGPTTIATGKQCNK